MPMKLLSADEFRDAAKDGGEPEATVYRFATGDPVNVEGETRTKRFIFSDATIDHAGDSIDPKGWDLGVFNANPVALWAHDSFSPPIGRASNVGVRSKKLSGDIEFATADVSEFADSIYRLVDGGFLKAVSVGFKPKKWAFTNDKDRPYGIDFQEQILLEISVCSVPCNPAALSEARSMGINTTPLQEWAEKVLDSGDTVFLPRKELETLRTQASASESPRFYIQSPSQLSAEAAKSIRENVKRWQDDPSEVLILSEGVELRTIDAHVAVAGEEQTDEAIEVTETDVDLMLASIALGGDVADAAVNAIKAVFAKAGRRVSAATKAKLAEAMGHHENMGKCIKDIMDGDGPDDENNGDDDDQPNGTVTADVDEDIDEDMTPEQKRIKEVRELRSALPTND